MAEDTQDTTATAAAPAAVPPAAPSQSAYLPPPMPYGPPPAKKEGGHFKRGFGVGFGFGIAMVVFGTVMSIISMIGLIGMAAALGGAASSRTAIDNVETVWGNPSASKAETLRAFDISGSIVTSGSDGLSLSTSTFGYEIANTLDNLSADDAAGVVLLLNTPGGTISGSKAIADAVVRYKERTGKKVFAYVRGMSASGGVYAMAGASEIISDYGSLIGSIGVIFGPFPRYKDVTAIGSTIMSAGVTTTGGITQEYLTQGTGKDFGNPFRDMSEAERANLMNGLQIEYNAFVDWVSKARNIPADKIKNELGAYIFDPKTAKEKGLIDQVMGSDEAFKHMAKQAGIDPAKLRVVRPAKPSAWAALFGAEMRIYGQSAPIAPGTTITVTSVLCSGSPQALVFHGSLKTVCG